MLQRDSDGGVLWPDELALVGRSFDRACAECSVTGASGKREIARLLLARYRRGADEDELLRLARQIISLKRGLIVNGAPGPIAPRN